MAQEWAKGFYKSIKWLRCRNAYIQNRIMMDGGLCEECHSKPGYIVYHKIILTSSNISKPESRTHTADMLASQIKGI